MAMARRSERREGILRAVFYPDHEAVVRIQVNVTVDNDGHTTATRRERQRGA